MKPAEDTDFDAEYDCDTLIRAAQIKADSKRFKAAQTKAREKMKALKNIGSEAEE